jgi:hypothetical protein
MVLSLCDPLPVGIGFGIGSPLGHPSVTQGPPKRHARVELDKCFVCNRKGKRPGGGGARSAPIAGIAEIARHRRNRKGKTLTIDQHG